MYAQLYTFYKSPFRGIYNDIAIHKFVELLQIITCKHTDIIHDNDDVLL